MGLFDYSDGEIAGIFIGGAFTIALFCCLGLCSIFYGVKQHSKRRRSSKSSMIKEQSESVIRGDHPIAFVLPTVSLSETGSEFSDLDGITTGYSSSTSFTMPSGSFQLGTMNTLVSSSPNPRQLQHMKRQRQYSTLTNEEDQPKSRLWQPPRRPLRPKKQHARYPHAKERKSQERHVGGMITFHWSQAYENSNLRVKVNYIDMGPEVVGNFAKFRISNGPNHQEVESHIQDLKSKDFMNIFQDLFFEPDEPKVVRFHVQNYRKTLTVCGECEILHVDEGEFAQLVNLALKKETDQLLLSLCYNADEEKLYLGMKSVKLCQRTWEKFSSSDGGLYVKVTLFEALKVIKAKKTKPISPLELNGNFEEVFSILFPPSYMDQVSCIISLCWKARKCGSKMVLGRTNIGPHWRADHQGFEHWSQMKAQLGQIVPKWHTLAP